MLQATPHCTMMDLYQSYALSQNLGDRPGTQCSTAPTFLAKRRLLSLRLLVLSTSTLAFLSDEVLATNLRQKLIISSAADCPPVADSVPRY